MAQTPDEFKAELEATIGELTPAELTLMFVTAGKMLMQVNTCHGLAPLFVAYLPESHQLAFYAEGEMADYWAQKFKETVSRCGGTQQEFKL